MNDDLISRQAAVELSCNVPIAPLIQGEGVHYEDIIFTDHIKSLPIVQPEQKTGRWSKQMLFDDGYGGKKVGYICSACRKYVPFKGNYCGNCGAKMESEG